MKRRRAGPDRPTRRGDSGLSLKEYHEQHTTSHRPGEDAACERIEPLPGLQKTRLVPCYARWFGRHLSARREYQEVWRSRLASPAGRTDTGPTTRTTCDQATDEHA